MYTPTERRNIMKTKEELNALREEIKALNVKLRELSEEELAQVTGGVSDRDIAFGVRDKNQDETIFNFHIYDGKVNRDFDEPKW